MLRILEQRPEWQERMRRVILTRELLELPEKFDRLMTLVQQLIEADRRHEAQIAELTQVVSQLSATVERHDAQIAELTQAVRELQAVVSQLSATVERHDAQIAELTQAVRELNATSQRHDAQIAELTQAVRELTEAQRRAETRLTRLENKIEGEIGRRDGERYERETVADAPILFVGGQGGSPSEPQVRTQVGEWLQPLLRQGIAISRADSPLQADIIWWKGDQVLVVEVGIKVSKNDVSRAVARAKVLRTAGINATPAVIGEEWGTPDVQAEAQQQGVEWFVGNGLSQGFLEFRKLPDGLSPA